MRICGIRGSKIFRYKDRRMKNRKRRGTKHNPAAHLGGVYGCYWSRRGVVLELVGSAENH